MSRKTSPILFSLILAVAAVAAWKFWPTAEKPGDAPPAQRVVDLSTKYAKGGATQPASQAAAKGDPAASRPTTAPAGSGASAASAASDLRDGLDLFKQDRKIEAREKLSAALLSYRLSPAQEQQALKALDEVAEKTIFSTACYDNDPYCFRYTVLPGDVLNRVETKLALHVPPPLILKVNSVMDASRIRANQTLKMINGPFHAIVHKNRYLMDVYLQRDDKPKVFAKRFRVGLGKDDGTPVGLFRVALGKKLRRAPWNPPPNSPIQKTILWGEPGYPLGTAGYWISLEGIDDNTRALDGYGIHGTNEPETIGRSESLGCIRMADADIDMVFSLLYEKWSTVEIRP
ncbi:MAG: putative L,D-transpeptidase YkuD [Planctomycetes bacterium ADurb.Bin126]|nr:MAG: putative L,D-transpeptidase YkuD [Planctomycetes bacterium ADurb.Bin126]HQL73658.1 L,D-transpeptidase [Phycisphaerae bacterium]